MSTTRSTMGKTAPERRYLSLALPRFATDLVARRMSPEARACPRVVVAMEKGVLRLAAVNAPAAALGLAPGLPLADARARHPALEVSEAEPDEAARMLARLADACERYTPLVSLDGADGLMLDVTGCAHLFGGEEGLVRDLLRRVAAAGFTGRAALAATGGAAFALARFAPGRGGVVVPAEEDLSALLAPLPPDALRLDGPAVEALARLGFRRVGDLFGKPRAPLAARFGMDLLRRLDEALGHVPTAVDYRFPPPVFCAERILAEPVERVEDVLGLAAHLAGTLAGAMERHGAGARRLDLALFRVDGKVTRLSIGTSRPLRDPEVVRRLFAEKVAALSSLDPGFGFELVRLAVREAAPLDIRQEGFGADEDWAGALDALVDRLATRFGTERVLRLELQDRHMPEHACREVPAQGMRGWAGAVPALAACAPGMAAPEGFRAPSLPEAARPVPRKVLSASHGPDGMKPAPAARAKPVPGGMARQPLAVEVADGSPEGAGREPAPAFREERAGAPPADASVLPFQPSSGSGRVSAAVPDEAPFHVRAGVHAGEGASGRVAASDVRRAVEPPFPPVAESAPVVRRDPERPAGHAGAGRGVLHGGAVGSDAHAPLPPVDGALPASRPPSARGSDAATADRATFGPWALDRPVQRDLFSPLREKGGRRLFPEGGTGAAPEHARGLMPGAGGAPEPMEGHAGPEDGAKPARAGMRDTGGKAAARGRRDEAGGREARPVLDDAPDLAGPARPLRLLERPEPVEAVAEVPDGPPIRFRWRRVSHIVARAEGPERIAAEWWRSGADLPARDYFRVETLSGQRFWLFRAGLYGAQAGGPAWFLHGLFG
ncbi:hypothetical protein V5F38_11475 [Xanthobacter sp. V0B-10]|uniref:Y-family DNA polymerase n=2 Tax=Xanthobacter albus TaxID=3119929 RepID=UPI00372C9024